MSSSQRPPDGPSVSAEDPADGTADGTAGATGEAEEAEEAEGTTVADPLSAPGAAGAAGCSAGAGGSGGGGRRTAPGAWSADRGSVSAPAPGPGTPGRYRTLTSTTAPDACVPSAGGRHSRVATRPRDNGTSLTARRASEIISAALVFSTTSSSRDITPVASVSAVVPDGSPVRTSPGGFALASARQYSRSTVRSCSLPISSSRRSMSAAACRDSSDMAVLVSARRR